MSSAEIRTKLVQALRLDLVGPAADEPQVTEILDRPPSRWYLTGFLVPWNAPVAQKADETAQDELELSVPGSAADEDETPEPQAARRGHFPSSIGISVLAPRELSTLHVTVRWGEYEPLERDGQPTGQWQRRERRERGDIYIKG